MYNTCTPGRYDTFVQLECNIFHLFLLIHKSFDGLLTNQLEISSWRKLAHGNFITLFSFNFERLLKQRSSCSLILSSLIPTNLSTITPFIYILPHHLSCSLLSKSALHTNVTLGSSWLDNMGKAAEERGLNIQYCMSLTRHVLHSVSLPAVTQIRVSGDYLYTPVGGRLSWVFVDVSKFRKPNSNWK